MKTIALALAATTLASAPASAGVYVNTELNQGYEGSDYFGRAIDFHIGVEGGEGKTAGGRHPVSPTGQSAKGLKTRDNKRTDRFIVKRRNKRKDTK